MDNSTAQHYIIGKLFTPPFWLLLVMFLISPAAVGDPVLFNSPLVRDMVEGDMRVMRLANNHGGLHLGLKSPNRETGANYASPVANNLVKERGLHLSYRLIWK